MKGEKFVSEDKTLKCVDCGQDFVFTAREQDFYAEKGFQNEPKRCPDCRRAYKAQRNGQRSYEETCSECGQQTTVPFEPKDPSRPVYCRDCYAKQKSQQ
jgi:CxxC-x17-CxxC domain-containing protein